MTIYYSSVITVTSSVKTKLTHKRASLPTILYLILQTMETQTVPKPQWRISANRSLLLLFLVAISAVVLCAYVALRKKRLHMQRVAEVALPKNEGINVRNQTWQAIKKILMCLLHRSEAQPLDQHEHRGITNISPLWHRKILMGERCQLPRFSGLILYDEQGFPLQHDRSDKDKCRPQEKPAAVVTKLKDLL